MRNKNNNNNQFTHYQAIAKNIFYQLKLEWELGAIPPSIEKIYYDYTLDFEIETKKFEKFKSVIYYLKELGFVELIEDPEYKIVRIIQSQNNYQDY